MLKKLILIGALIAIGSGSDSLATVFAFIALVMATINVIGGFMVTNRMLEMIAGRRRKGGE